MLRLMTACLAFSAILATVEVRAQNNPPASQELRRQIEQLQQAVAKIESTERKNERVTDIGTSRSRPTEIGMIVRLYDINDLFAVAPNYEAMQLNDLIPQDRPLFPHTGGNMTSSGGGMGGASGGGIFSIPDGSSSRSVEGKSTVLAQVSGAGGGHMPSARTSIDDLIAAIQSTISPTEWSDVGGAGSIARLGNTLLISADSKTHDQIEALLGLFRQRWKTLRTVTLRAHWLWLTDKQLGALLPDKPANNAAYALVDDALWLKRPQGDQLVGPGYRAVITCYNGQTVNTVAGGQSLLVTHVQAVSSNDAEAKDGSRWTYSPSVISVQDGAGLQITPLVSASGKYVVLDVHSRVTKLHPHANRKETDANENRGPAVTSAIDRTAVISQRLATTLRVPVNQWAMVGGMTFGAESVVDSANLYLFINATVQELQDENPAVEVTPQKK